MTYEIIIFSVLYTHTKKKERKFLVENKEIKRDGGRYSLFISAERAISDAFSSNLWTK